MSMLLAKVIEVFVFSFFESRCNHRIIELFMVTLLCRRYATIELIPLDLLSLLFCFLETVRT